MGDNWKGCNRDKPQERSSTVSLRLGDPRVIGETSDEWNWLLELRTRSLLEGESASRGMGRVCSGAGHPVSTTDWIVYTGYGVWTEYGGTSPVLPGNPRCYTAKSGTSTRDNQDNKDSQDRGVGVNCSEGFQNPAIESASWLHHWVERNVSIWPSGRPVPRSTHRDSEGMCRVLRSGCVQSRVN